MALSVHPILVVDDERLIRDTLAEYLTHQGFEVHVCASGEEALTRAADRRYDVVLCDVQLPGLDGIELLAKLQRISAGTCVIMMTAYATVENAVEAFQRGAHDYLMKPLLLDEVRNKIQRAIAYGQLHQENQDLRRELNRQFDADQLIGTGLARVQELIRKVAPTKSTVLIQGESGTGKELIARAIHRQGLAPDARFLAVNCAAIPQELLESQLFGRRKGAFTGADRDQAGVFVHAGPGTVFLDEIGELPQNMQAKLLRTIEQKEVLPVGANEPVDVQARVIAATNKNLKREVTEGRFRQDLFYRLDVVTIHVPPLRERRDDIPELVEHLLARHTQAMGKRITGVSHEAMQLLRSCPWRGNVRELENVLQRAVILGEGPLVTVSDLPPDLVPAEGDPTAVDDISTAVKRFEKQHIERILRQVPDKREAARRLGMGLSSLYRRIAELGIS
ncbi:MAG: sigma-54-dependent transcriptional regulator [Gemmataceae bacterium]